MIITRKFAEMVGYNDEVKLKGSIYMFNSFSDPDYSMDGRISFFPALKLDAEVPEVDGDDETDLFFVLLSTNWYVGYRMYDWIPDKEDDYEAYWEWLHEGDSEWDSTYDPDKPFLYKI